jgi:hypothetical protein
MSDLMLDAFHGKMRHWVGQPNRARQKRRQVVEVRVLAGNSKRRDFVVTLVGQ